MSYRPWIVSLAMAFVAASAWPQELTVLSQEREGSATVYHSRADGRAVIVDGGRRGGLTAPRMNGKPVLEFLRTEAIEELVIVCSHPHDDHAAGLREIIRSDRDLRQFKKITFVDSGYPVAQSLYQLFKATHPDYTGTVDYKSAQGADVMASILDVGQIRASNLAADPVTGAKEHGHSIVTTVTLERDGKRFRITDYDDADDLRVGQHIDWVRADPTNRAADVIIPPHHGSDGNDITPFLSEPLKPKAIILTANGENQYIHPGPRNLQKWVDALGIENVFVTGAAGNVRVTADGTITAQNGRSTRERMLAAVLRPELASTEKDLFEREEKVSAGGGTSYDRARLKELRARRTSILALIHKWDGGDDVPPIVASVRPKPPRPPAPPTEDIPKPPPPSSDLSGGLPFDLFPSKPKPKGPVDLTGGFKDLVRDYRSTIGKSSGIGGPSGGGGGGGARVARFRSMIRIRPVFGGIVLGNGTDPKSSTPARAKFILNGTGSVVGLEVAVSQNGSTAIGVYDDFTSSELWAAYHIVAPTPDMAAAHGLDEPVPGLVGMTRTLKDRWEFGVHPAIAGTLLARDAMRLDMRISIDGVKGLRRRIPEFSTYQWYDENAIIRVDSGRVDVKASEGPPGILLRVRLWKDSWASSRDSLIRELLQRFVSQHKRVPDMEAAVDKESMKAILKTMVAEVPNQKDTSVPFDCAELVDALDQKFDAFRRIERLAHLVAVLNWLLDDSKLPPLPAAVKAPHGTVQPVMWLDDVLGFAH